MAPSTLGTFLRAFTFGHVRQLDAVIAETIRRAWSLGAGPGASPMTIDVDSTICEVFGKAKGGAAYGYTRVLGYHPLVATWAKTGEVLHARLRKGSSQRGVGRFAEELVARVRRAGATGSLVLRADAGFFSWALIDTLTRLGVCWTITVIINPRIRACIEAIDESAWQTIFYPDGGEAQVAETTYVAGKYGNNRSLRLVVRRTRLGDPVQQALWPNWRHHAFVTNLDTDTIEIDQYHRDHARVELAIRDLKCCTKKERDSSTAHRASSSPMRPGLPVLCSPTISFVGPSASAISIPTISSPSLARSAVVCSPFPDAWSTGAAISSFGFHRGGHGTNPSREDSRASVHFLSWLDR
jgi:hypothetical protein